MPTSKSATPRLLQCASLWTLAGYPSAKREWSIEQKLRAAHEAGFDGVATGPSPEIMAAAARHGLAVLGGFDVPNFTKAAASMRAQKAFGIHWLNIQMLNHDTPPAQAAAMAVKLIALSDRLGMGAHIEAHRDTATETPEKYTEIARRFRQATGRVMPTTWDHSHFAVVKHLSPQDYSKRLLAWPKEIQASHLFHLRPFNGHHCQVPVTDGRGRLTPEFRDYLAFVEDLFALWLAGPAPRGDLWACPELGATAGYLLSGDPDVWLDVVRARREYAGAWRRALQRTRA